MCLMLKPDPSLFDPSLSLQPKPQQIHHTQFFPALGAKIMDILNTDVRLPSVIPAFLFAIPVETGIQIICQFCCKTPIQNIFFLKFSEASLAGFHNCTTSPSCTSLTLGK